MDMVWGMNEEKGREGKKSITTGPLMGFCSYSMQVGSRGLDLGRQGWRRVRPRVRPRVTASRFRPGIHCDCWHRAGSSRIHHFLAAMAKLPCHH